MYTKDEAYTIVKELTIRFGEQNQSYKKSDCNETLVRRDFIDTFFKALGWDIDNSQGYAEAYHEDKIKVGSATKVPKRVNEQNNVSFVCHKSVLFTL